MKNLLSELINEINVKAFVDSVIIEGKEPEQKESKLDSYAAILFIMRERSNPTYKRIMNYD